MASINEKLKSIGSEKTFSDISNAWLLYITAVLLTILLCFIYSYLLDLFAGVIVWGSIAGFFVGIIYLGYVFYSKHSVY
jgi:uncharacterized membrane protein YagU involved in acid resistance